MYASLDPTSTGILFGHAARPKMTNNHIEINANATRSEIEKVPDIQSLIARAHDLGRSVDWWNSAMLWTLGFAALAAVLVVITTRMAILRAGQLTDVQGRIIELKEGDAGLKISAAQQSAGEANERSKNLEHANLELRGQVASLETAAAHAKKDAEVLHKAALDAKAAQQTVETHLGEQQERAAKAERELLELQQRIKPRHLTDEQARSLIELFQANPAGEIAITCINGDKESCDFAAQLAATLKAGGWKVMGPTSLVVFTSAGGPPIGVFVKIKNKNKVPIRANVIVAAFARVGLTSAGDINSGMEDDAVELFVGVKP